MHRWKVEISHAVQDAEECLLESPTFEVGVIEANGDYSTESIEEHSTRKWVYAGPAKKISTVVLKLDMEKKSLVFLPGRRFR